jgi:hypothetical protein
MSAKDPLKRRILAAIAAGPACLLAATVVVVPATAQAATNADKDKGPVVPTTSMPSDGQSQIHQWWANGWRHPWGNWNNWHNWANW